ncbi:MAG: hypothetical protein NVS3B12_09430 [Acidimicrobiales bacterium]
MDVDVETVDPFGVAGQQSTEPSAGADRAELAVIANHDQLGSGRVDGGEETTQVGVIGQAALIEDDHVAGPEAQPVMVEAPPKRRDGAGLADPRAGAQPERGLTDHVAVPYTAKPPASNPARTAARAVVLPDPATRPPDPTPPPR